MVVGGVEGVTYEPGIEPYDDLVASSAAAILEGCTDESQSACSLAYDALLAGLDLRTCGVIVGALPGSDCRICGVTGQAYLDLDVLTRQRSADPCQQCLILAPR